MVLDDGTVIRSVLIIRSKPGAVRANHYHKKDSHYVYMLEGEMEYTSKPMDDSKAKKETVTLVPGDLVFTPPMTGHAMRAIKETTFLALATESRGQDAYEEDTVRIKLVE
jgi:quercetin dioxygenase-like cupin family protein